MPRAILVRNAAAIRRFRRYTVSFVMVVFTWSSTLPKANIDDHVIPMITLNADDRSTSLTNGRSDVVSYRYDGTGKKGLLVSETASTSYNADSRPTQVTAGNGSITTTYGYDSLHRATDVVNRPVHFQLLR